MLLTATGAAFEVARVSGRPYSPDAVRYHAARGRIPSIRTAGGVRLYRSSDVRAFAGRLARRSA